MAAKGNKVLDLLLQRIDKTHQQAGYPPLQQTIREAIWSELLGLSASGPLADKDIRAISRRLKQAADAQSTRSSVRASESSTGALGSEAVENGHLPSTKPQILSSLTRGISKASRADAWEQLLLNDVENWRLERSEEQRARIKQKSDFRKSLDEQVCKRKQQQAERKEQERQQHLDDIIHWDALEKETRSLETRKHQQRLMVAENCLIQSTEFSKRRKEEAERRRHEELQFAEQARQAYEREKRTNQERKDKARTDLLGFLEESNREKQERLRNLARERDEERRRDEEFRRTMEQKEKEQAEAHEKLKRAFQRRAHMVFPTSMKSKDPADDSGVDTDKVYSEFLTYTTGRIRNEIISAEMARQNLEQQIKEKAAKQDQEMKDLQRQKELVQMDVESMQQSERERMQIKKEMQRRYKRDLEEQIRERQAQTAFAATDNMTNAEKSFNSEKLRSLGTMTI